MRKLVLSLIVVLCVLMFYTGCDGDGDGTSNGVGGGDGGGSTRLCPCDFFSVPMTDGCWNVDNEEPAFGQFPLPDISGGFDSCNVLTTNDVNFGIVVWIRDPFGEDNTGCWIRGLESDACQAPEVYHGSLTRDQIDDCLANLEEYATVLNFAGITVTGGPPYACIPDDPCLGCWDY